MTTPDVAEQEKRRIQRISLPLPSRVEVKIDQNVCWNEVTRLTDVSAFGAGFSLNRPLKRGRLVLLTVPMPRALRCFDFGEAQYRVWSLVRRCIPARSADGVIRYSIGVAFIGKNPPPRYIDDPSMLYEITRRDDEGLWHIAEASDQPDEKHLSKEERRQTRFFIPEPVTLEVLTPEGSISQTESTVTENISLGGAAIFTSLMVNVGEFVRITSDRHNIKIISVVRGRRIGPDGIARLHLEFIDHLFPLEGIE
jgi:PilZ domain